MAPGRRLSPEEFALIAEFLRGSCGLDLDSSKGYLVEGRLQPLLAEEGCASYFELYRRVRDDASGRLARRLVDAISTKETFFFREGLHFELFRGKLLADHIQRVEHGGSPRCLSIWSAACATGQEVYSIAIAAHEALGGFASWQVSILGTDISESALAQAEAGMYRQMEMDRGLSPDEVKSYFVPTGERWKIRDDLRRVARFQRLNLLDFPAGLGRFDLIFCRNVAIYFSAENRRLLFDRLADHLQPHGALIVGSTETLVGISQRFQIDWAHGTSFYRLARGPAPA